MTATDLSDYDPKQHDGSDKARRVKDAARRMKDGAAAVLHDHIDPLVGQARTYADQTRQRFDGAVRTVTDKAREKPATSALAILGVGILVGAALAITLRRPATHAGGAVRDYSDGLSERLKDRAHDWSGQIRDLLHR